MSISHFITTFFQESRKRIIRRCRHYLELNARKTLEKNTELWKVIEEQRKRSQSTGCSYIDYLFLYNYIRTHKPLEVLECGTGISTVVMAYALLENEKEGNHQGRITSMEENEEWFKKALINMPDSLKKYVDCVLSPVVEDHYAFFRELRYRDIPKRPYDLVFVDGPKTRNARYPVKTFDFDFIWVVSQSPRPVFCILDLRLSTFFVLREVFGREKARFDEWRSLCFIGPCSLSDLKSTNEIVSEHISEFR